MADSNFRSLQQSDPQSKTFYPVTPIPRERTLRRPASLPLRIGNGDEIDTNSLVKEDITKLLESFEEFLRDTIQKLNATQKKNLNDQSTQIASLEEALLSEEYRNEALKVRLARQVETSRQTIKELEHDYLEKDDTAMKEVQVLRQEVESLIQNLLETRALNDALKMQIEKLRAVNRQTLFRVCEYRKLLEHLCVKQWGFDFDKIMRDMKMQGGV